MFSNILFFSSKAKKNERNLVGIEKIMQRDKNIF